VVSIVKFSRQVAAGMQLFTVGTARTRYRFTCVYGANVSQKGPNISQGSVEIIMQV